MGLFGIETGAEGAFGQSLLNSTQGRGPSAAQTMLNAQTAQAQKKMAGMAANRQGVNSALALRNAQTAGTDLMAQNAQSAAMARAQEQMQAQQLYGQYLNNQSEQFNKGMGTLMSGAGAMTGMLASDERAKTGVRDGGPTADEFMGMMHARDQRAAMPQPALPPPTGRMVMVGGPRDETGLPIQPPAVDMPDLGLGSLYERARAGVRDAVSDPSRRRAYEAGMLARQRAQEAPGRAVAQTARAVIPTHRPMTEADRAAPMPTAPPRGREAVVTGGYYQGIPGVQTPGEEKQMEISEQAPIEQVAQPHTYRYRDQHRFGGGSNLGVMAQDVQHVAPGMVQRGPDGILHVDPGRLAGATAAATGRLHDRLSRVEAILGARNGSEAGGPPPKFDVTVGPAQMIPNGGSRGYQMGEATGGILPYERGQRRGR